MEITRKLIQIKKKLKKKLEHNCTQNISQKFPKFIWFITYPFSEQIRVTAFVKKKTKTKTKNKNKKHCV